MFTLSRWGGNEELAPTALQTVFNVARLCINAMFFVCLHVLKINLICASRCRQSPEE